MFQADASVFADDLAGGGTCRHRVKRQILRISGACVLTVLILGIVEAGVILMVLS